MQQPQKGKKKRFRLEIEGLRALAAFLVAVYHIWFNRVSGGVDVFFVVSGFLITTSILSMIRREGKVLVFSYIIKLLKRLIPTAWTIALLTFIASFFILPAFFKEQLFDEVIASLFYFENWRLAWDSIDYLAQNNEASPFQHYWALSIQFQFYLIWLVLFFLAFRVMKWTNGRWISSFALPLIVVISIVSFIYSVYYTNVEQSVAYYHTFTRVWEFGVGGILAFTLNRIEWKGALAFFAGWTGVIGLLLVGIVLQVSTVFPGYAALWPVLSAVLILCAGNQGGKWSAYRFLSSKPLVSFGSISYAFYLWHWPILILYYGWTGKETVSFLAGLGIIAVATFLAYVTIHGIERPVHALNLKKSVSTTLILVASLVLVTTLTMWKERTLSTAIAVSSDHPGGAVTLLDREPTYTEDPIPDLAVAAVDRSAIYDDDCINMDVDLDANRCEYGETENYRGTIALAGGSHAAHWQPMLDEIGKKHNIRITTYLKGRCRFSTTDVLGWEPCEQWMDNVLVALEQDAPDLVFTVGDISVTTYEEVPDGYIEAWKRLERANIPLLLIRDTPRYREHVVHCLDANDGDAEACRVEQRATLLEESALERVDLPSNVIDTIDITNVFCDGDYCTPIVGNIITHFDKNHLSATFSRSLAPVTEEQIVRAFERALQQK